MTGKNIDTTSAKKTDGTSCFFFFIEKKNYSGSCCCSTSGTIQLGGLMVKDVLMLSHTIITPIATNVAHICPLQGSLMLYAKFIDVNTIETLEAML